MDLLARFDTPQARTLGFGCAPLGGRVGPRAAERALETAYDLGVRYFDTARSYGYGESEAIVGRFARGRRADIVIGTKAGIRVARPTLAKKVAKAAARRVFDVAPGLRTRLRGVLGRQHDKGHFTADDVRASVEESLRELRTDYIDVLFLHECPASVIAQDDVFDGLERLRKRGALRSWGVSSDVATAKLALTRRGEAISALQYRYNLWDQAADALADSKPVFRVANQPFAGGAGLDALAQALRRLSRAPSVAAPVAQRLRQAGPRLAVDVALNTVRTSPTAPLVLCSMTRPEHVRDNVEAITSGAFDNAELDWLRAQFRGRPLPA